MEYFSSETNLNQTTHLNKLSSSGKQLSKPTYQLSTLSLATLTHKNQRNLTRGERNLVIPLE